MTLTEIRQDRGSIPLISIIPSLIILFLRKPYNFYKGGDIFKNEVDMNVHDKYIRLVATAFCGVLSVYSLNLGFTFLSGTCLFLFVVGSLWMILPERKAN